MAINYISKFNTSGIYQSQNYITGDVRGTVRDCLVGGSQSGNLTSYYIKNDTTLCKYVDGVGEITYTIPTEDTDPYILDISLNRDATRLYYVYYITISGTVSWYYNYIETSNMNVIGNITYLTVTNQVEYRWGGCMIDSLGYLWMSIASTQCKVCCINLDNGIILEIPGTFTVTYGNIAINKNNEFFTCPSNTNAMYKYYLNAELDDIETILFTNQSYYVKDVKIMTDGRVVLLTNNGTNSSIIVRSGTTFNTIDLTIDKTGELWYHLLLDSDDRIYADRFEVGVKERWRWDSDGTNATQLSDRLGNNHFNEDDTGYIHSEMTGNLIL